MKQRTLALIFPLFFFSLLYAQAQQNTITGTVSDETGQTLPGASVVIQGTVQGVSTDMDGKYSIEVEDSQVLDFSFIGYVSKSIPVGTQTIINVSLEPEDKMLTEVVVTALGISREKRSLGYSTQQVSGDEMSNVKTYNYVNSISGKASGVQIKRTNNIGGSTNIIIRGSSSLTGNNQALFVINGVPVNNNTTNSLGQRTARTGYDYGNPASDINPDDIESINILKGAAAAALYGSRAANGVVLITTKKGKRGVSSSGKSSIGVSVAYGFTAGVVDKSTFPKYQNQYGAGYGKVYGPRSDAFFDQGAGFVPGGELVPYREDASFGAPFDLNKSVYHWNSVYSELPDTYKKAAPWVAAKNGPITFFETPITHSTSVSLSRGFDQGSFRLGYSNFDQKGILPNSKLTKNNVSLNFSYNFSDRLTASGFANYIKTEAIGRNSTGYSGNLVSGFRQWWQRNVDIKDLKRAYEKTGLNTTWNPTAHNDHSAIYWDNLYWTRYKNYQSDQRSRFLGTASLNYKITDWLSVYGRASVDMYNEFREERKAVGSNPGEFGLGTTGDRREGGRSNVGSGYARTDISFSEVNYQVRLDFNKDIGDNFNIKGILGANFRRTDYKSVWASTNGGLVVPGIYAIQNSVSTPLFPYERDETVVVNGMFINVSLGYGGFVFLDGTLRRDVSSTLPKGNNEYYYPSASLSFVFSHFIPSEVLTFGKFRANYASIGNSALFDRINNGYTINSSIGGPSASVSTSKKNPNLKPELTESVELGLEMDFLDDRIGFDLSLYERNTTNQILPLEVSRATGYGSVYINAGKIQNRGVELSLRGTPIRTSSGFKWDVSLNWTKNESIVKALYKDESGNTVTNYTLASPQGGISLAARVGESYGAILGTDYLTVQHEGKTRRVVNPSNGKYYKATNNGRRVGLVGEEGEKATVTTDNVIGNVTPDWTGGITNRFSYKGLSLSFLIDMQVGGDIYSLDQHYGLSTGLYAETAFTNDKGNPVRNANSDGGGYILKGVNLAKESDEVISENTGRHSADGYGGFGYAGRSGYPNKAFVYDASYVKLREVVLSYSLPSQLLASTFFNNVTFSFVGSNLWIIHKNLPHADPESGLGAGNIQGYSTGSLPTTRNFTFNVKFGF